MPPRTEIPPDSLAFSLDDSRSRNRKTLSHFLRISQFLTWPFTFLIFNTFFQIKINGQKNFALITKPFIIIANHVSFYDSFLFRLILGFSTPHLPLRFMAVKKFEWPLLNFLSKIGFIDFIYSLFGVFTVVPGLGLERNLINAQHIINDGDSVVIYPEGKIFTEDGIGLFKKGAAVLMRRTEVPVIPVAFRIEDGDFIRKKILINVGAPIVEIPASSDGEVVNFFHSSIVDLYESYSEKNEQN